MAERRIGAPAVRDLGFYVLLTVIMTYPLLLKAGHAVLGPPGDNMEYLYKLWWFKRALFDLHVSPFFNPDVFYPRGYYLALHEMTWANIALGMPLTLLWGEILSYNALVLLSFVLSGFGAYMLAMHLSGERLPSLLGGVLYAFCSYRMAHLAAGHLNLLGTQWLPFLLLCIDRALATGERRPALLAGLFFALSALSSWYYAPMFAILSFVYVWWRPQRRECARDAHPAKRTHRIAGKEFRLLLWSVATAGVLLLPSLALTALQRGQSQMSFSLSEVDVFSASLGDLVIPNILHPLWGLRLAGNYVSRTDVLEHVISVSWIGLGLALLTLPRRVDADSAAMLRRVAQPFWGILAVGALLSLGTTLHVGGQRVYFSVPAWLESAFTAVMGLLANRLALHRMPSYYELRVANAVYFPLPTLLLYLFVPFFDAMRVWARFALFAALAVAVLASLGLARLQRFLRDTRQVGQRACLVAAVLLLAVVAELWVAPFSLGWSEVQPQPVDLWLAEQEIGGAVIRFPLWQSERGPGLYSAATHHKPLAYGYGGFFPADYRAARPILWGFPADDAIELLRDWDVRYVLVSPAAFGDVWPEVQSQINERGSLQEVARFSEQQLYHRGWLAERLSDLGHAFLTEQIYVYRLS